MIKNLSILDVMGSSIEYSGLPKLDVDFGLISFVFGSSLHFAYMFYFRTSIELPKFMDFYISCLYSSNLPTLIIVCHGGND